MSHTTRCGLEERRQTRVGTCSRPSCRVIHPSSPLIHTWGRDAATALHTTRSPTSRPPPPPPPPPPAPPFRGALRHCYIMIMTAPGRSSSERAREAGRETRPPLSTLQSSGRTEKAQRCRSSRTQARTPATCRRGCGARAPARRIKQVFLPRTTLKSQPPQRDSRAAARQKRRAARPPPRRGATPLSHAPRPLLHLARPAAPSGGGSSDGRPGRASARRAMSTPPARTRVRCGQSIVAARRQLRHRERP